MAAKWFNSLDTNSSIEAIQATSDLSIYLVLNAFYENINHWKVEIFFSNFDSW